MPWATRLQTVTASGAGGAGLTLTPTFGSPVSVGQLITVFLANSDNSLQTLSVMDNLGNVYSQADPPGGGPTFVGSFWSIVTNPGTCTLTCGTTGDQLLAIGTVYGGGAPILDQFGSYVGEWPPPISTAFRGFGLLPFSTADSLIVSCIFSGSIVTGWASDTGDSLVTSVNLNVGGGTHSFAVFERMVVAPGTADVRLRTVASGSGDAGSVMVFSKPLPRPPNITSQYAMRPSITGNSFIDLSLPYIPAIGSLMVVGFANMGLGMTFTASDLYGNVYTPKVLYDGTGAGIGGSQVGIVISTVAAVPSGNGLFKVRIAFNGTTPQRAHPGSIALAEYVLPGRGAITGYNCVALLGGTARTAAAALTGHNLLVAMAAGTTFASVPFPATWAPGSGLTIEAQLTDPQTGSFMQGFPNAAQIGVGVLMDQFISADGSYQGEVTSNAGPTIVMIAIPYTPAAPGSTPWLATES